MSKKRRIPRKLKKKWLKMGIRFIIIPELEQKGFTKWNTAIRESIKQPLILKDGE
jgi:hypothetical protein